MGRSDQFKPLPEPLNSQVLDLRKSGPDQRRLTTMQKNAALIELAARLEKSSAALINANRKDLEHLPIETPAAFRDRLTLNPARVLGLVESVRQVAALPDPVGEVVEKRTLINGLEVKRVRAPIGILFMIFEARPNVIVEAFSLAFKSGNSILLRGGTESKESSHFIYQMIQESLLVSGLSHTAFFGLEDYDRGLIESLLQRHDLIDVVIPRGGEGLIHFVQSTATMPIIKNDRGLCHAYVAETADMDMAVDLVVNGKTQRPGVCNSLETVLVDQTVAKDFLPRLYLATNAGGLEWRADPESLAILDGRPRVCQATNEDWDTEHLDLILNCRIVSGLDPALRHIAQHGSRHSELIITSSETQAQRFLQEVDAAAVYWNASTRFTDGFELGLGGELGISTQKLHVRGPVGLRELTTPRWIIKGNGQIRS